jgi:hypothetical protein
MKKLFLLIAVISLTFAQANAQCTPAASLPRDGIFPDSATGFMPAFASTPYSQIIQLKVPSDTVYLGATVSITRIAISGAVQVVPPINGFNLACGVPNCSFPGGQINCANITATPSASDVGAHQLIIPVTAYGTFLNIPLASDTIDYYYINVYPAGTMSVEVLSKDNALLQMSPNPATDRVTVDFSAPKRGRGKGKGGSSAGVLCWDEDLQIQPGVNRIPIDVSSWPNGIYFIQITFDDRTFAGKLVVQH